MMELMHAEGLINNWKFLPGLQVKIFITHLIKAFDLVSAYILNDYSSIIERDYLTLSSVRLFEDVNIESAFYDNYFFFR